MRPCDGCTELARPRTAAVHTNAAQQHNNTTLSHHDAPHAAFYCTTCEQQPVHSHTFSVPLCTLEQLPHLSKCGCFRPAPANRMHTHSNTRSTPSTPSIQSPWSLTCDAWCARHFSQCPLCRQTRSTAYHVCATVESSPSTGTSEQLPPLRPLAQETMRWALRSRARRQPIHPTP